MKKKPKMDPSLMKSEFMWEQPKKKTKFYKNWKLYAIALPVVAVAAGTGSGVYLGINSGHKKVDLNKLGLNTTIQGQVGMSATDALDTFLDSNREKYPDLRGKVIISGGDNFTAPKYITNGQLIVSAAKKSNYSGQITITISQMGQFDLNNLDRSELTFDDLTPKTITRDLVFTKFLGEQQNQNLSDLESNVTLNFTPPTYNNSGSLVITPKVNDGKYKNSINIPIAVFKRKELVSLLPSSITGINTMVDSESALRAFFATSGNEKYHNFVEPEQESFKAPTTTTAGSLTIKVNNVGSDAQPYSGEATITISKLTDLNEMGFVTSLPPVEDESKALEEFIKLNPGADVLRDDVKILEFQPSTYQDDSGEGSFKIVPKSGTKYGLDPLVIKTSALSKTDIGQLLVKTTISGVKGMTTADALDELITENNASEDLRENLIVQDEKDYHSPNYSDSSTFIVSAKANGPYKGSSPVNISAVAKTNWDALVFAKTVSSDTTKENALQAFIDANKTAYSDLEGNVELIEDSFVSPGWGTKTGSYEIKAIDGDHKYEGIPLKISILGKKAIALNSLKNDAILGKEKMTEDDALQEFLNKNNSISDSLTEFRKFVKVQLVPPEFVGGGMLTISALPNSDNKYSGKIEVPVKEIGQTNWDALVFAKTVSSDTTKENALQAFIDANKTAYPDLEGNVELIEDSFVSPGWGTKTGSYEIKAINHGKYSGNDLTITINPMLQKSITDLYKVAEIHGNLGDENSSKEDLKKTAWDKFTEVNSDQRDGMERNITIVDVKDSTYTEDGYLEIAALTPEYEGDEKIRVVSPGQISLEGLDKLINTVSIGTTKETALRAFIDANKAAYPDLEGNVELVEDSFSGSTPTEEGHYTIRAKEGGKYKYKGNVSVTIPFKKVLSSVITKNVINEMIADSNQIISKVLGLNPGSGLGEDDLEIVDGTFVPSNGVVPGKVQIKAVNQNIFSVDPVEITFGIMPIDEELKQLIDNIKLTQRNSNQERSAYRNYFSYYSNEKLQDLADKLGTIYEVKKSLSLLEQERAIEKAIQNNINALLDQVIVKKDGLTHDRYGYDTYEGANASGSFAPDGKTFNATIRSIFVWKKRDDESADYKIQKDSSLTFKFKYVD